jgi:alkanesulfonate monooxygenase SsuD/methylene tetrahydromethanopterin reductase-like flavin-dependent oxidoreductase (luciferase family)
MQPGSVSLRLYPHLELPAREIVRELLDQARLGEEAGFDGLMVSEHHNGFAGYLPNPIQAAGWLLEVTREAWAAPCPLLLPLRPAALVAEELAWLAARFPRRVGVGLAAGSLEADFTIAGTTKDDLTARFAEAMTAVSGMLLGRDAGPLPDDPAIARRTAEPIPVVSAAMSPAACRRAANLGVGLLFDSLTTVARCRELAAVYREAGGNGPIVLIRRAAPGVPPADRQQDQLKLYRSYAAAAASAHWGEDQLASGDPASIAEALAAQADAVGADCLNLRIHSPGIERAEVRSHIAALADVRALLDKSWRPASGASAQAR